MVQKMMKKYPIKDYIFIAFGSALMALGIGVFLVNAKVVPGGASGLAMSVHYITGGAVSVGLMYFLINIPLFFWGYKELGPRFGFRTILGFSFSSFFLDLFVGQIPGLEFIRLDELAAIKDLEQNDFFFLILIGAVLLGVGIGIIFKFKGTTAGSDIVAAIMQKRYGIKPGQAIMIIDTFVILLAGFIIEFKDLSPDKPTLSLTLYAFFLLFVSSRIIDVIIDGFDYARSVFIISDKYDAISKRISTDLSRGATAMKSRGLYRDVEREVIFTIVTLKELGKLEDIIKEIDPDAFVVINNVHEVLGNGFRRRI